MDMKQKIIEKLEAQIADEKDARDLLSAESTLRFTYDVRIEAMTDMIDEIRFM